MDTQTYDTFLGEPEAGTDLPEGAQAHQEQRRPEFSQKFVKALCSTVPEQLDHSLLPKALQLDSIILELQTKAEQALHQARYEHEQSVERLQHTSAHIQDFHRRVMEVLQSRTLAHKAAPASVLASMTTGTTPEPTAAAASPGPNTPAPEFMR